MKSLLGLATISVLIVVLYFCGSSEALNPCSVSKMRGAYNEMVRVRCKNCDKYFHCKGNYEAVHKCGGILQRTTAETMSDARELFGGNSSGKGKADSDADQVANRYGRGGGNCAARYLRPARCAYNPKTRQCKW